MLVVFFFFMQLRRRINDEDKEKASRKRRWWSRRSSFGTKEINGNDHIHSHSTKAYSFVLVISKEIFRILLLWNVFVLPFNYSTVVLSSYPGTFSFSFFVAVFFFRLKSSHRGLYVCVRALSKSHRKRKIKRQKGAEKKTRTRIKNR